MPKRNPDRRRKSSRKRRAQSHNDSYHSQAAYYQQIQYNSTMYANGDVNAATGFSEDSIRRQLGYGMGLPIHQARHASTQHAQRTRQDTYATGDYMAIPWREEGCRYTYAYPTTHEDVVVWVDGKHWSGYAADTSYCDDEKHADDSRVDEREYRSATYCQGMRNASSSPPPSFKYVEGYHDPILKDQTEDWWRLFGHDVPVQFILAPIRLTGHEEKREDHGGDEDGQSIARYPSPHTTQAERTKEKCGEWDAAVYFAPYCSPKMKVGTGFENEGCGGEEIEQGGGEKGDGCKDCIVAEEAVDEVERRCSGRDEWECDFCGVECFCWTVEAHVIEVY